MREETIKPFDLTPFETDRWFGFKIHDTNVLRDAKFRNYRRIVELFSIVLEVNRIARHSLDFEESWTGWTAVGWDKLFVEALGISLPLPRQVEWKSLFKGRRFQGQFGPPSEPGAPNSLQAVRPDFVCPQPRVSSVILISPGVILSENGQADQVVLRASTGLVELRIDPLREGTLTRQRVARLVGVGSRFKDVNSPIGSRELFFLRLLSGVRCASRDGRTCISESNAVIEFDCWVKLGLLTFNKGKIGKKQEEELSHTRLTKNWRNFVGQMHRISPTLGKLFRAEWIDSTSKVYSIGLVPGAVEDQLSEIATLSADLLSTQLR
jgi:hypothetical protein